MMRLPALPRWAALASLYLVAASVVPTHAQPVYRIVGPDGKVTFSDKPPPDAKPAASTGNSSNAPSTGSKPALPYELQQLASKYPVTLYSSTSCGPCDTGRSLLTKRGVPFTEKTVNTNEDLSAFARISKDSALPLLLIGGQTVKGYSDTEWTQYLDAAGYPKQSILPTTYRPTAPEPLSPLKTAGETVNSRDTTAETAPEESRAITRSRMRPIANPNNPTGIRF